MIDDFCYSIIKYNEKISIKKMNKICKEKNYTLINFADLNKRNRFIFFQRILHNQNRFNKKSQLFGYLR